MSVKLTQIIFIIWLVLWIPRERRGSRIEQNRIVNCVVAVRIASGARPLPNYFILEIVLAENLVEHHLHIVAGVPVAVIIETACLLQNPRHLHAAWPHEFNVGLG